MNLLFFPFDTVKTRLQSVQGFVRAGGFRGIYQGVGSVVVGSAPGGTMSPVDFLNFRTESLFLAAVFFAVYDTLKQHLSLPAHLSPVTHVISASVAEVVCVFLSLLLSITLVLLILLLCARQLVSFAYPQK